MREILFRGQTRRKGQKVWMDGSPVNSNWVEGYGVCMGKGDFSVIYAGSPVEKFTVYTDTVGQFTGRVDNNGKKIFEGDIVVVELEDNTGDHWREKRRVRYNSTECCWYPMRWEEECDFCDAWTEIISIEVIGNIHDNPELMEVE